MRGPQLVTTTTARLSIIKVTRENDAETSWGVPQMSCLCGGWLIMIHTFGFFDRNVLKKVAKIYLSGRGKSRSPTVLEKLISHGLSNIIRALRYTLLETWLGQTARDPVAQVYCLRGMFWNTHIIYHVLAALEYPCGTLARSMTSTGYGLLPWNKTEPADVS